MANTTLTAAYIALGANLGEPLGNIDGACALLEKHSQIRTKALSPIYKSIPHGDVEQPDYHNAVLSIETELSAQELLTAMHDVETAYGRERLIHWGARTLDLDLILFGTDHIETESLIVPHPRAHQREFVVKPLYDLDAHLELPPHGSVSDILTTLPLDNLQEIRHGTTYHH